ncbi:MAG: aminotransferase class III-fold pyridoxal phosphate-dependent enzyme, partial [Myxococcota bacterium]|nr:aminotransferase class III-fold pyridoxal phosphate-dependent enzyme [Myxococcota bacterium]
MTGKELPRIRTEIPGPKSQAWIDKLSKYECPAITARRSRRAESLGVAKDDPIVWESAVGSNVTDVDGNVFIDLTAGFGVAGVGHRNPSVSSAGAQQLQQLIHAMGDAFPDPTRIRLLEKLSLCSTMDRAILGCSGSDSIDAAVKTAWLASGRSKVLAFSNSYHGLAFGSLPTTDYKANYFRKPFADQLGRHVVHHPFGEPLPDLKSFGAVLVEPIQGRGGIRTP